MIPSRFRRLLTERKHIALLGAVAILVVPASASAAGTNSLRRGCDCAPNRDEPHAVRRIGNAKALDGPLLDPVRSLQRVDRDDRRARRAPPQGQGAQAAEARSARRTRNSSPGCRAASPSPTLKSIAACESGGNPEAVSPDGTYRGLYQFDHGTWASVGGNGDPAAASAAEQNYRAALLYSQSGSSPWPVCG